MNGVLSGLMNASMLRDAVISGANNILNQKQSVDMLNVFPVPDGDTGTNMSMTIGAAARELQMLQNPESVARVADVTASALLRGARGNSGVILSLLFRGIAKGLKGLTEAGPKDLALALGMGVEAAYKAVMKPTEGTILTVAKVAAMEAATASGAGKDLLETFEAALAGAKTALANTPELLPVLKKAGVVDAGGQGLVVILEGMLSVLKDGKLIQSAAGQETAASGGPVNAAGAAEEDIQFTYCNEYLVKRDKSIDKDPLLLRAYLETIGDCVVVVDDDDIIKVHVHSNEPNKVLAEGLTYGQLINIKIENMRDQHERARHDAEQHMGEEKPPEEIPAAPAAPAPQENDFGFVAVAAGEGLHALFADLGVDHMVNGGQTMNPSTDDILAAIEQTPAKTVFVLPNNKNIIMAAEQAVHLATRRVIVLQTRTIPMGISAMLHFDPDLDPDQNAVEMSKAADAVGSGQITYAARDSEYDGYKIKQGEILALANGKVSFVEQELTKAVVRLTKELFRKDSSFVTLIYGEDVSEEEAAQVEAAIAAKIPEAEITTVPGGQPVYYYIISVE